MAGIIAFAIGLAAATWRSFTLDRTRVRADAAAGADRAARGADTFIAGELRAMEALAATPTVRNGDARAMLELFDDKALVGIGPGGLTWIGPDGHLRVLSGTPPSQLATLPQRFDFSKLTGVHAILTGRITTYVGPAAIGKAVQHPILPLLVATHDDRGRVNGVLGAVERIDRSSLRSLFGRDEVVVDASDQVIWDGGPVTKLRTAPRAADVPRLRSAQHGSRTNVTGASGAHGRLVGFAPVPNAGWVVTQERSWSDAISSARQRLFVEWLGIALASLAALVGTLIGLRRTREAQRLLLQRSDRDELLATMSAAIAATPDLRDAAGVLMRATQDALGADGGTVVILSPDGRTLRRVTARIDELQWSTDRLPLPDGLVLAPCFDEARTVTVASRDEMERVFPATAQMFPFVAAIIATPLVTAGPPFGAVAVGFAQGRRFSADDIDLVEAIAVHAAPAIERSRQADLVRERDAHAALAAAATGIGSWTFERGTGSVWWSPSAYDVFGIPEHEDDFTDEWLARIVEDDAPAVFAALEECATTGRSTFTYRYRHPRGLRWVRANATVVRGSEAIAGTVFDVTAEVTADARARARAEAAAQLAAAARAEDVADVAIAALADQFDSDATVVLLHDAATDGTTVIASNAWSDISREAPLDLTGRPAADVLADGKPRYFETAAAVDDAYPALAARRRADGVEAVACVPLLAGGRIVGVVQMHWHRPMPMAAMLRDDIMSFASKIAQALDRARLVDELLTDATRSEQLAQLAADLAQITDIDGIVETTSQACIAILGTQTASVVERADERHYHVHLAGQVGPKARRAWYELPVSFDSHPARVFRTGQWQLHTSPDAISSAFPVAPATEFLRLGVGAMVSVPLTEHGAVHGVLTLTWSEPHDPTPQERDWIATVASAVSQGVVRSRLARSAEIARERAEALARLAAAIAELRDPAELALTVVDAVRAATGADRATVFALDDDRTALVRAASGGMQFGAPVESVPIASNLPVAAAARTRGPVYHTREELLAANPELAAWIPEVASTASLPMVAHGQLTGVLTLAYRDHREFDREERAHLAAVTTHTALALERARLFHEQRDLAETLQRSMLPGVLTTPPGLAASGGYAPGTEGLLIGGDWYDVVGRSDGSALVVVGDVAGHGREAAIIMGRLRTLVTAHATLSPGDLLDVLHEQCVRDQTMATCAVLALDPISGETRAANAGHLPLVVVPPDGAAHLLDVPPSLPLGVGVSSYPTHELRLEPGTLLVAYTDGLVERRRDSLSDSLLRLVETCDALRDVDPDTASATLLARLDPEQRSDDTVVLVVKLAARHAPLAVTVPAAASSARVVREPLKRWLVHEGVPDGALGDLLVATGEAVANAIVHAYPAGRRGPIHVTAAHDDGAILVTVADEGTWRAPRDERGMGLALIRSLVGGDIDRGSGGTTVRIRYELAHPVSVA